MPVRLPSYIYRNRCGIFYFRVVLPLALAAAGDQREFRISLETAERTLAVCTARYLTYRVTELFTALTDMARRKTTTPPATIRPDPFKEMLQEARKKYNAIARAEELEQQLEDERMAHRQTLAAQLKKAQGVVKQAYAQGILKGAKLSEGARIAPAAVPTASTSPLMSQVIQDYERFKKAKDRWTSKTREENLAALKLFVEIVGDTPIAEVTDEHTMLFAETLKKLPPNRTKRFPGMSLADILARSPEPISVRTFNKTVERVSSLFKWAQGKPRYRLTHNPAAGLSIDEADVAKRVPFTTRELVALFSSEEFRRREFQNVYTYWLMPLALFTGARQGELTQLFVSDIDETEGIPCFKISDEEEGQKLKTGNAKRLVPVHSALIELGFLRYVERLRVEGVERVFPELSLRRDGYGHAASNWFQRYKKRCNIHEKQTKVFHSFRHNFIGHLLDDGVPEHVIAKLVGHEGNLITTKVYWNASDARKRQPFVERFKLAEEVMRLIPKFEDIRMVPRRGPRKT